MGDRACDIDTYICVDCTSLSDGWVAFATCNGGGDGDCGWSYDLRDGGTVSIDREEWLRLEGLHRKHSATVALTAV